jgi:hypothetical protein
MSDDFETVPVGTMKELERLKAMESRFHELIADYEFMRRGYFDMGDKVRSEMFAERIEQIETAMRGR